MRILLAFCVLLISGVSLLASNGVKMADMLRSNGKIWIVVGVLLIIFIGMFLYILSIDRKLKRLEKDVESTSNDA